MGAGEEPDAAGHGEGAMTGLYCTRCERDKPWLRAEPVPGGVRYQASGRLVGISGKYLAADSASPEIRLCEKCLSEIWPEWRRQINK